MSSRQWTYIYWTFFSCFFVFLITLIVDKAELMKPIAQEANWSVQKLEAINNIMDWVKFIFSIPTGITGGFVGYKEVKKRISA